MKEGGNERFEREEGERETARNRERAREADDREAVVVVGLEHFHDPRHRLRCRAKLKEFSCWA